MDSSTSQALERRWYTLAAMDILLSRAGGTGAPRYAARAAVVEQLWDSAPFSASAEGVPELRGPLTPAAFAAASGGYRRPVVLRGFGAETAAVQRWTPAHLAERLGSAPSVVVEMDDAARNGDAHASRRILHEMPFDRFVARMRDEALYLHNATGFASQLPELVDELDLPRIQAQLAGDASGWDGLFSSNLFVGGEKVYSNLHCAPGGNFFLQIHGAKTWTLVDPALSPYLAPVPSRPFNHCLSAFGSYRLHRDAPDCPLHRLPRSVVRLEPGDVLYNPPWWWHEVENHGDTIGCAIRHVPPPLAASPTWRNHRLFSALSVYPKLWAFSAVSWARHRLLGSSRPMRAFLNPRLAAELNRARGR